MTEHHDVPDGDGFAEWLRARRRERDRTQAELADAAGCTSSMLKKIEQGIRQPSHDLRQRLIDVLSDAAGTAADDDHDRLLTIVAIAGASPVTEKSLDGQARALLGTRWSATGRAATLNAGVAAFLFERADSAVRMASMVPSPARVAIDTGLARRGADRLVARAQSLLDLVGPGTVAVSETIVRLVDDAEIAPLTFRLLGRFQGADGQIDTVFRAVHAGRTDDEPTETVRNVVPIPATPTIGRDELIAHTTQTVRDGRAPIVTLAGPGGVGKTRVAVEAAHRLIRQGIEVHFVDLSMVVPADESGESAESGGMLAAIAYALLGSTDVAKPNEGLEGLEGLKGLDSPAGRRPADVLRALLADRDAVLVLDSIERHVHEAETLAALLAGSATRVLVTSRLALEVRAEHLIDVAPLAVEPVGPCPALDLFRERARTARGGTELGDAELPAAAELCRRLDGLPLAIELAAARLRGRSTVELLTELDRSLDVLQGELRDLPARQRTLRATVEWSLSLLNPVETGFLESLAVFPATFTAETAAALCPPAVLQEGTAMGGAFSYLESLVAHNVVTRQPLSSVGEQRWRLLRIVREHLRARLAEVGRLADLEERHARFFLGRSLDRAAALYGPTQATMQRLLAEDLDDIRVALSHLRASAASDGTDAAALLVARLLRLWAAQGLYEEGQTRAAELLTQALSVGVRARLLNTAGTLAFLRGDLDSAEMLLAQSEKHWSSVRTDEAVLGRADALANLGVVAGARGDLPRAQALTLQSYELRRLSGDRRGMAISLGNLGLTAREIGDLAAAIEHLQSSIAIHRELGDHYLLLEALEDLSGLRLDQGDRAGSAALLVEAATLAADVGRTRTLAEVVVLIARWLLAGRPTSEAARRAGRLMGVADALRGWSGVTSLSSRDEEAVVLAGRRLGARAWAAERTAGETHLRSFEPGGSASLAGAALTLALDTLRASSKSDTLGITSREIELLRLAAEGHTIEQMATEAHLSASTVRTHLRAAYAKLGAVNRASAIRAAAELDLL